MTTASGAKFGKTEAGTVWLDAAADLAVPFYQFWLNTDDRDVVRVSEVLHVSRSRRRSTRSRRRRATAPEKREAQRVLAREVTTLVHGAEQVARAERASSLLFGEDIATLPVDDVLAVFEDVPSTELPASEFGGDGHRPRRSGGARAAGAVEERSAAAGAVGRRVREQPARVRSAGAADARAGDRRAAVRAAERAEADIISIRLT